MEIPRRVRLDKMTAPERAICDVIQLVELMGAAPELTNAIILLGQAQRSVADYVDRCEAARALEAETDRKLDKET